jgi:hypothetical protein
MAQPRSPWVAALFLGALAALIFATTSLGWRDQRHAARDRPLAQVGGPSTCVTPQGLCQAAASRAGDPCSCPNLLRGMVPGHIERLGAPPVLPRSSDWARGAGSPEPTYDWDGVVAP